MEEIQQIAIPGLSSLSEESHLAGKVKKEQPVLVVLGNPPYSGISANINEWTERLLKEDIDGTQSYYKVDGQPLGEKNPKWLQDDYVKFLRFAQWKIQKSGYGIVGMITNHGYLDNPTFRGMRQSLMKTFDEIYILDLHGNSLKKETTPEGGKDENVFDIQQGVAIALFVRNKKQKESQVFHMDLFGLRENKYDWLGKNEFLKDNYMQIKPHSPYYFLVKRNTLNIQHYLGWKKINDIFPVNNVGIVTSRDHFVISFNKNELKNKILQFKNLSQPDEIIAQAFNLKDKSTWKIKDARKNVTNVNDIDTNIKEILYRPFDKRYIFYHQAMIERMRHEVMRHMLKENIAIITARSNKSSEMDHFFITDSMMETKCGERTTQSAMFPLYTYPDKEKSDLFNYTKTEKEANIPNFLFDKLSSCYGQKHAPEEILYYIYGVFYSNIYRETYAEFLKIDFPRVPFTADYDLFKKMGELGKELADLHLLKSPALDPPIAKYQGGGDNDRIEKIAYKEDEQRIYINKNKYFEGIAPEVWNYHIGKYFEGIAPEVWNYHIGGYQVLRKYLKDRKGRIMNDAPRYCRIITALSKTIEIQEKIDEIYPEVEKELVNF
jgi:predicted helicase